MKPRILLLAAILLLGLGIIYQRTARSQLVWQTIQTTHGDGTKLIGTYTMQRRWRTIWTCRASSTFTLQIDSDGASPLRETVPCDGSERSKTITMPGTFYVAVTTTGEWTLKIQESS